MTMVYKYLNFTHFKDVDMWDSKRLESNDVFSVYKIVKLGDFINEENEKYNISDPNKSYKILGVNNQTGIFDAYIENGGKINQKYKRMDYNWIAYNPYRINVGSIGIKGPEIKHDYISPAYVVLSCKSQLNPSYLYKLMRTVRFNSIIKNSTTGSVRQNLGFPILSNFKIPLPSLPKQNKLVSDYEDKISRAQTCEEQAKDLEFEIQNYLNEKLGIQKIEKKEVKGNGLLKFVRLKEVEAWSVDKLDSVEEYLINSKYKIVQLGDVLDFVTKRWSKSTKSFRYIELSSIDEFDGITGCSELQTMKAPSRATQIVEQGDLIVGLTRPYLKKIAVVDKQYSGDVCSSGFQVIQNSEEYNNFFICEYLKTGYAIKQFEDFMTGALYPAITSKDLRRVLVPLPSKKEQDEFMNHISEMKSEIKQLKTKAVELRLQALEEFENEIFE